MLPEVISDRNMWQECNRSLSFFLSGFFDRGSLITFLDITRDMLQRLLFCRGDKKSVA